MTDHVTDTAYDALADLSDSSRWAFGTGFVDLLSGVDTAVRADVDAVDLAAYCVMLADDALVMSHRLQQWLTRAPELEEETAIANIALDLLGQARWLLTRAGQVDASGRNEDAFAFWREEGEYRNVHLVEPIDADFAGLVVRLLVFSTWRYAVVRALEHAPDPVLAAVATRGAIELAYHRDYAAAWVVRLGGSTELAHDRVVAAVDAILPFVDELFTTTDSERRLAQIGAAVDPSTVADAVDAHLAGVFIDARVRWPRAHERTAVRRRGGGRAGRHTDAMAPLLAELQCVARAHPGASW